ncbi:hypothetical protein BU26DRAFT_525869 [Trematosphaeria pertusa]|uniref:Metallothionein n=1 Tax=Trematosphaeria pertusa TaxID=390896 RepID=A0A6A6HRA6_9PLEO|nr:uncharacterized protein BU26DRAFT_525869 [Trematosphaeria pertusa]KAF2240646.1 hypothetical protein BU26DRAFT_525869 [Trematosphaeria pertusa]
MGNCGCAESGTCNCGADCSCDNCPVRFLFPSIPPSLFYRWSIVANMMMRVA